MDGPAPTGRAHRAPGLRIAAVLVSLAIVALCVVPAPVPPGPPGLPLDKLGHLAAFALAAFLWRLSGLGTWATLGVCAALALGTEAVQGLWLPERSAEWADLAADLVGAALGVLLATRGWAPLRRLLARLRYGRRARAALAEAQADLAALTLPEAIARREQRPVAARRRPLALRGLASAMGQAQRRAGAAAPCLPRALALLGEARTLGFAPHLVLGVRAPDEDFGAHAWLELDGRPFLEDERTPQRFTALPPIPPTSSPH